MKLKRPLEDLQEKALDLVHDERRKAQEYLEKIVWFMAKIEDLQVKDLGLVHGDRRKAREDRQKNVWFMVKIERPRKDALKKVVHEDHITLTMEEPQEGDNLWIVIKI